MGYTVIEDNVNVIQQYVEILSRLEQQKLSLYDRGMDTYPHDQCIEVVLVRLKGELEKSRGKKLVIDITQMPKVEGFTVTDWLDYFERLNILVIDSNKNEG